MLLRSIAVCALITGFLAAPSLADEKLEFDAKKSKIEFVGKKKDGSHKGGFKEFTAEGTSNEEHPEKGTIKISIKAASLFSDDEKLTSHLKNPDFFDVAKHPTITFESKKIEIKDDEHTKATIVGTLKLLGKEEALEVPVTVEHTDEEIVVKAKFKLDRTKWGMSFGKGNIENDVEVNAVLHFDH